MNPNASLESHDEASKKGGRSDKYPYTFCRILVPLTQ